jgi:hypothetical protein
MTLRSPRARRRPPGGVARAGAVAILALAAAGCSGGDDAVDGDAVPTLLTAPVQASSTSTSSSTTTTTVAVSATDPATTPPPTTATSSSTVPAPIGDTGSPSGPGAAPDVTSSTAAPAPPDPSTPSSTTPTTAASSTTADIEPPPPSLASTVPIPTAAQPPDTTGGQDLDFLLAPRAIAGLQFGASRTTVLNRLSDLLGDPLRADTLPECAGGPGTALQWFNVSVIVTTRGLGYYIVGMNVADYADKPVPGWHTAAGLSIGGDRAQLEAVYPGQIAYGAPSGAITPFTVTAGGDTGLNGQLENDVLHTVSSGTATC